jgi:hypothetical protein
MSRGIVVFTSMNEQGWNLYGHRFVDSFLSNWPSEVRLRVYAEGFNPGIIDSRIEVVDFQAAVGGKVAELAAAKERLFQRAGISHIPGYRHDVVKFSKKALVIAHEIRSSESDYSIWLDSDIVSFRKISVSNLLEICGFGDDEVFCAYLRRYGTHTESGFLGFNVKNSLAPDFCERYEQLYLSGGVFHLEGWTDCHVFDAVKAFMVSFGLNGAFKEIPALTCSHPFVNSPLGFFMDHLKGDRKVENNSRAADYLIPPRSRVKFDGRYSQLEGVMEAVRPKTMIEVGVWSGWRGVEAALMAQSMGTSLHYRGYDVFDQIPDKDFDGREKNVKPHFSIQSVVSLLELAKHLIPSFTYELVVGDTNKTLQSDEAELVFLDGGHAVETIAHDYLAVSGSKVILFDDYYVGEIDTSIYGCNRVLEGLPHLILPASDPVAGGGAAHFAVMAPPDVMSRLVAIFPDSKLVGTRDPAYLVEDTCAA